MHILWSSEINLSQIEDEVKAQYKEEFDYGVYKESDLSRIAKEYNQTKLSEVKAKYSNESEGGLVVIADLERWSKHTLTVAHLNTNQVSNIFQPLDDGNDIRWYTDNRNLRGDEVTKQGINHYIFRELRENKNINKLKKRLEQGEPVTAQLLNYYTRTLLPYFEEG